MLKMKVQFACSNDSVKSLARDVVLNLTLLLKRYKSILFMPNKYFIFEIIHSAIIIIMMLHAS